MYIMSRVKKLTRRDFLKLVGVAVLDVGLFAIGAVGYGVFIEPGWFTLETVHLKLPRLASQFSGIRIVQISDIHMGGWMNPDRFQRVADLIIAQAPDLLLISGDFLIGDDRAEISQALAALDNLTAGLSRLANDFPTFAVLGNHDYWTDAKAVRRMLSSCGITDLTNTVFTLQRGGERLHLCGVDDVWEGEVRLDRVIAQLHDDSAAILMAHEPDFADTSAATGRFDLQLSGHTHGGQVVLPLLGPPVLPYLGQKYSSGLYKVGEMFQYTNRGLGMVRLNIRVNCPPEITLFVLETGIS